MHRYIITGVSGGLGKSLAEYLLQNNTNQVVGIGRKSSLQHPRFQFFEMDLSEPVLSISSEIFGNQELVKSFTLINNAGVIEPIGLIGSLTAFEVNRLFQTNVMAAHQLMNAFVDQLQTFDGQKTILNISSGAARYPVRGWSAYCASKAALDMLSLCLAEEQPSIQVYSLAPGIIDTPMQGQIRSQKKDNFPERDRFQNYYAQGELQSADFVAKKIVALLHQGAFKNEILINLRNH